MIFYLRQSIDFRSFEIGFTSKKKGLGAPTASITKKQIYRKSV